MDAIKKRSTMILVGIFILALFNTLLLLNLNAPQTNDSAVGTNSKDSAQGEDGAMTNACANDTHYSAHIGKFSLTLSSPNRVIRILDDEYEGGPITSLSVGQCSDSDNSVIDIHPDREISILAHPDATAAELRESYEAEVGISFGRKADTTIADVTAEVYTYPGLTQTTVLYFDSSGIGYEIEIPDDNPITHSVLDDITSDWSFIP